MAVAPMVHTTLPKEDNMGTSSVEAPTAQALVARLESKAPDDNLGDDDPDFLNFECGRVRDHLPDELPAAEVLA
jgi:hypothetical protein